MFQSFWSSESCVAVNVACVCSNINQTILVDEREICGERRIKQCQIIVWCFGCLAVMIIYAKVLGNVEINSI